MNEELGYELQRRNLKRDIYDWLEAIAVAFICMILIFTFIARRVSVNGQSMEPTLQNADSLVSSRLFYKPKYGDMVVITQPNEREESLIKRVIAVGGQTVDMNAETGEVSVDGAVLYEPYIYEKRTIQFGDIQFPFLVPEGRVFVMGDNRNDSWDSRYADVGTIDERYILGRVVLRITPIDNIGNPDKKWKG